MSQRGSEALITGAVGRGAPRCAFRREATLTECSHGRCAQRKAPARFPGSRELGIRLALGATPHGILLLIVRQGLTLGASGGSLGLVAAFVLTRFVQSLLYGVSATDP